MSSQEDRHPQGADTEVVRWYTRARRFPQLIGRTPDGTKIWGGPYTVTQVLGAGTVLVVGLKTTWLWARADLFTNAFLLIAATLGTLFALGRIPIGSRNPVSMVAGAVRAFFAPRTGRLAGQPVRPRRPKSMRRPVRVVVAHGPAPVPESAAAEPTVHPSTAQQTDQDRRPLTGLQSLLATAGRHQTHVAKES